MRRSVARFAWSSTTSTNGLRKFRLPMPPPARQTSCRWSTPPRN